MTDQSVSEYLALFPEARLRALVERADGAAVERALAREERTLEDFAALVSPAARPYLERMAREAQRLTRWHFGRTISLYAPIYLSNLCAADCVYCGFAAKSGSREKRITLGEREIRAECEALAGQGFESVLLLTGEAPKTVSPAYIARGIEIAREYFAGVSAEVYAVDEADYERFVEAGLEGITLYMETYHRPTYSRVHLMGGKADYDYRLEALERAGRAGVRKLNLGALLGLFDWRLEALWLGLHAKHLQRECWQSALGISFPRLIHTPERYAIAQPVSDVDLVQCMLAVRLFLPEVAFNLSTREHPDFRDKLIPLGVTHMSAGSSTQPGGYATYRRGEADERTNFREVLEQFEIEDHRPVPEVVAAIRRAGYDPVWKDYDHAFDRR
jgi:2-iminoacetate synthase